MRIVEADRVMSDSQVFVAERRDSGRWVRVATVPRSSVRAVERRALQPAGESWLVEDVRTTAGVSLAVQPAAGAIEGGTP